MYQAALLTMKLLESSAAQSQRIKFVVSDLSLAMCMWEVVAGHSVQANASWRAPRQTLDFKIIPMVSPKHI